MRILIVCGGSSVERDESLADGKFVGDALQSVGHQVTYFDPGDDTAGMLLRTVVLDRELVFPLLYGAGGEDGRMQAVLGSLGVPYVGSLPATMQACYDKVQMLNTLHSNGILVPQADIVKMRKLKKHPLAQAPFVLKSRFAGSRYATRIIPSISELPADIENVFNREGALLIEPYGNGIEFTVPIVGDRPLPVAEQVGQPAAAQYACPSTNIPLPIQQQAQAVASRIYQLLGCRHLASVDFVAASDGHVYCTDVHAMPRFGAQEALMVAGAAQQVSVSQVVNYLVNTAVRTA